MRIIYEQQLAVFEALRRLGFKADDIFMAYNRGNPCVVLRAQGKEFPIALTVDPDVVLPPHLRLPDSEELYIEEWLVASAAWNENTLGESERRRIYATHILEPGMGMVLVTALLNSGFTLPRTKGNQT